MTWQGLDLLLYNKQWENQTKHVKQGRQVLDKRLHCTTTLERLGTTTASPKMSQFTPWRYFSKYTGERGNPKRASDLTEWREQRTQVKGAKHERRELCSEGTAGLPRGPEGLPLVTNLRTCAGKPPEAWRRSIQK